MINFAKWRSRIDVPQQTHDTLKQLAKEWPLVAITNGNAQPELCGLGEYFEFVLRAGPHGRSKPFSDMYFLAAEKLNVPIGEILHVGDDLTTDVGWRRKNLTCRSVRSYMSGTISPLTWVGQFAAECRPVGSDRKMAI